MGFANELERMEGDPGPQRSRGLVYLLAVIPGAGHMYLGLMRRGTEFMLLTLGLMALGGQFGRLLGTLMLLVLAPVVWFYSLFDAGHQARHLENGEPANDRGPVTGFDWAGHASAAGIVFLIFGGFGIVDAWGNYMVQEWLYKLILPVLLLAGGGYMLLRGNQNTAR